MKIILQCWPVLVPQIVGGFRPVGPTTSNESRHVPVRPVSSAISNIVKSNLGKLYPIQRKKQLIHEIKLPELANVTRNVIYCEGTRA